MPHVEPLTPQQQGPLVRMVQRQVAKRVGKEPDTLAAAARNRPTYFAQVAYEAGLDKAKSVPTRLKELATLKAAMVVGCEFCCDIGSHLARTSGVPEAELRDLVAYAESPHFDARDRAVLDLTVAMSRTPSEVDDALTARLREHFDDQQLVELAATIAWENYRARLNHALGFGAQGFSEGAFCVRPEGRTRATATAAAAITA